MINTTLILYRCNNPEWGHMLIQTEEHFPTPERALEIYKDYLRKTPLGQMHPNWVEENSTVETQAVVISNVLLSEDQILKLI